MTREIRIPNYVGKTAEEILAFPENHSGSYFYRSLAWLDYFTRKPTFSTLLYAATEGRQGIEYLLFEELVVSVGANLTEEQYLKCLKDSTSFAKTISKLTPDYLKLRRFTSLVASLEPAIPKLIEWNHKSLMNDWGKLSEFLHWVGARTLTSENTQWLRDSHRKLEAAVKPIWINFTSGTSGILRPENMHPTAKEIWERFRSNEIDESSVLFQLAYMRPER